MIELTDYVPVLRGKKAEFDALGVLEGPARGCTRPLIEVAPMTFDEQTEEPVRTLEDHLDRTTRALQESWSDQQQNLFEPDAGLPPVVLYDLQTVGWSRTSGGDHPVEYLHAGLRSCGLRSVPVARLDDDRHFLEAVASVATDVGICLRLDRNQFSPPSRLMVELYARLVELGVSPDLVDIVIDLEYLAEDDGPSAFLMAQAALEALPDPAVWRSVVVVGSSFPTSVASVVRPHEGRVIKRAEWEMYASLADSIENLARLPTFGDYGIEGHTPDLAGPPPKITRKNMSPSIRYTGIGGWYVIRGSRFEDQGNEQYHGLAGEVTKSPHWQGSEYCWGDGYISRCAVFEDGPGSPQKWRQVGVNHHVTQVTAELASLFGT